MRQTCRLCGLEHEPLASCRPPDALMGALMGKVVGNRYRVGEVLGTGASGTTFAAEHVAFPRPCALKVVRPRYGTPELTNRVFHGDAVAAWSISHPSLVEVVDIGALPDGTPFFVMERLEGETLATRLSRDRLSLAAAIDMMMQLLSAVVALHARELLVRDLRPNNVFLVHRRGCRPLVKILDTGLGRLAPVDPLQEAWMEDGPQPGAHPHYLSPERIRGEHAVDVTSDIFVAGAIFYESLAGERAFNAMSWRSIIDQVTRGEPIPLHERRGDIPVDLSNFVSRSMSANPRSRPQTAKEMQDELRTLFEDARKQSVSMFAAPLSKRPSNSMRAADSSVDEAKLPRWTPTNAPPPSVAPPPSFTPPPNPASYDEPDQTVERFNTSVKLAQSGVASVAELDDELEETKTGQVNAVEWARMEQTKAGQGQKPRR